MPKVSIIVPCFNAEQYLDDFFESLLCQTMKDFEVIFVDNNSSDGTASMLSAFSSEHTFVITLSESKQGPGCARNAGARIAKGEWLYFPDVDDIMKSTLLEKAVTSGESNGADIVVFSAESFNDTTHEIEAMPWSLAIDWLPEGVSTFSPVRYPNRLLNSFQNWAWNKLFKTDFIRSNSIEFPELRRTEDLPYTGKALTQAKTVSVLREPLYCYRVGNPNSAIQQSYLQPLDFYRALLELKESLEINGLWDTFEDSFMNLALGTVVYNTRVSRTFESFEEIVSCMKREGFTRLGLDSFPREKAYDQQRWDTCEILRNGTMASAAFRFFNLEKAETDRLRVNLSRERIQKCGLQEEIAKVRTKAEKLELSLQTAKDQIKDANERIAYMESDLAEKDENIKKTKAKLSKEKKKREKAVEDIQALKDSNSWKVGRAVTLPARKLKALTRNN